MNVLIGLVLVLASVVGGFVLNHGKLAALWQPYELLIIGGAALGAFICANPLNISLAVFKSLPRLLTGSKFKKPFYLDLLALIFELQNKARKDGLLALESDVEDPYKSPVFGKYPKVLSEPHVVDFIADYLRLMIGGTMDANGIESLMDVELETHHEESNLPGAALTKVADALPGFGIVAAVMGVVITMASLNGPPAEIGAHVAAALVGTFLGILLAYGVVGPLATLLEHLAREEAQVFVCLKTCLLASLQGHAPAVVVEFGRKAICFSERPGFQELEDYVKSRSKG